LYNFDENVVFYKDLKSSRSFKDRWRLDIQGNELFYKNRQENSAIFSRSEVHSIK